MSYFLTRIPSMSQYIPQIKRHATRLCLSALVQNIIPCFFRMQSKSSPSYDELIFNLFSFEVKEREAKQLLMQMKKPNFHWVHDLDKYDYSFVSGLAPTQLSNYELNWLDQCYNLMLSGPSGTGKTYIRRTWLRRHKKRLQGILP